MSRANVGIVIQKLLTDENLRSRFALDPGNDCRALAAGFLFTRDEILFSCAGPMRGVWFLRSAVSGAPRH